MALNFQWLKQCTEIPLLLLFYSFMITDPISTNFIIYRTCYVTLGYNQSDCEKLGSKNADNATRELEKLVQPHANTLSMVQDMLGVIFPALFCLYVGPWSDKHGRKPVLISTFAGFLIGSVVVIVIVLFSQLSPWYLLLASISRIAFGGFSPLMMATLAYITDITTTENRGLRIGVFEVVMALGMLLGTLSSSSVFEFGGYITVFAVSAACYFLAFLYCLFVLTETVICTADQDDASIFSCSNIYDMVKTTFKSRQGYARPMILISILMIALYILGTVSDSTVFFMFLREQLHWDLQKYTLFKSLRALFWIIGTFLGLLILHKLLKIKEAPLLLIAFITYLISAVLQGFATDDWFIYTASVIRCIGGIISPMCRSLISKMISSDENGKIFSITVAIESLILSLGGPMYTLFYNYTLNTNPALFNFLTVGIFGFEIILVIIVIVIQRMLFTTTYTLLSVNADD